MVGMGNSSEGIIICLRYALQAAKATAKLLHFDAHQQLDGGAAGEAGGQDGQHRRAAADHRQLCMVADVPAEL